MRFSKVIPIPAPTPITILGERVCRVHTDQALGTRRKGCEEGAEPIQRWTGFVERKGGGAGRYGYQEDAVRMGRFPCGWEEILEEE